MSLSKKLLKALLFVIFCCTLIIAKQDLRVCKKILSFCRPLGQIKKRITEMVFIPICSFVLARITYNHFHWQVVTGQMRDDGGAEVYTFFAIVVGALAGWLLAAILGNVVFPVSWREWYVKERRALMPAPVGKKKKIWIFIAAQTEYSTMEFSYFYSHKGKAVRGSFTGADENLAVFKEDNSACEYRKWQRRPNPRWLWLFCHVIETRKELHIPSGNTIVRPVPAPEPPPPSLTLS